MRSLPFFHQSAVLVLLAGCAGALPSLPALADSEELAALVSPTRVISLDLFATSGFSPVARPRLGLDGGVTPALSFDWRGGAAYASHDRWRWRLLGARLGQDNPNLQGEAGEQGRYRLFFDLRESRYGHPNDGYRTPYVGVGAGGTALALPAGLVQAATNPTTADALPLLGQLQPYFPQRQRNQQAIGGSLWLTPELEWRTRFEETRNTGTLASGATMGTGGNAIALILPEPIDQRTRQFDTRLDYQRDGHHLALDYSASFFSNAVAGWRFDNPFAIPSSQAVNHMGSAPDNRLHRLGLSAGYRFGPRAHLTASAAYGRLSQDTPFQNEAGLPLPRGSLDGLVVLRQFHLKLATRPLPRWRLNASLRLDGRDNRSPQETYRLPAMAAGGEVGAGYALDNHPLSRDLRQARLESSYTPRTGREFSLQLRHDLTTRHCHGMDDCIEVDRSREQGWQLAWREAFSDSLGARLTVGNTIRRGAAYEKTAESIELAGMRKFHLADRDRAALSATLDWALTPATQLALGVDTRREQYRHSPFGLQSAASDIAHIDLSHAWHEDFSLSLFAHREMIRSRLNSSFSNSATAGVTDLKADGQWQAHMDDIIDTLGLGFRHRGLWAGQLVLDGAWVWMRSRSPYEVSGGSSSSGSGGPLPLPAATSRSHELRLNARYTLNEYDQLRVGYLYRRLASADFLLDRYSADSVARLLGTDESAARYAVHVLGIGYQHRFH